ncbi:hypothetical protein [Bradyrhizobium sp. AUGA SZCCT0182]|nr:hypothetical protein [Bradyrhizobium sp. AUGA SZCCT0182]
MRNVDRFDAIQKIYRAERPSASISPATGLASEFQAISMAKLSQF